MKLILSILLFIFSATLFAQITTNSQWTWMKGDNTTGQNSVYGTQGVSAATNKPAGRSKSVSWKDNNGNFWLFGGTGYDAFGNYGELNDLWKFDPSNNQWTWMNGDKTFNHSGIYGIKGVGSATNKPGCREGSTSWIDNAGNLWLFGGEGYFSSGDNSYLNDLWKYTPSVNQWTWVKGDSISRQSGVYGTQGIPDPANNPGCRDLPVSWTDSSDNLWMFGGYGIDGDGNWEYLNDLWKYDISSNQWTWINGDNNNFNHLLGVYGVQGIASPNNKPGGRWANVSWRVGSDLWLMGGIGYAAPDFNFYLNDLWKYNIPTNQWTWVKGDSVCCDPGIYGTKGIADPINKPGSRWGSVSWKDEEDNIWLFGGQGSAGPYFGLLNDLWKYDIFSNQWTWVKGDNVIDNYGVYGTKGVASVANKPGSRVGSLSWIDSGGNFWLFGGSGYNASSSDALNDIWKLNRCGFTWIGITSTDWTVSSNWCGGIVPGANDNVIIPSGTPNSATVPSGVTASVRSLTITTGAQVFIGTNAHLNITH